MTYSYKNTNKLGFLDRIFGDLFHKTKMIEAPIEFTQKEIKLKLDDIIRYLSKSDDFNSKQIQKLEENAKSINVYFHEIDAKYGENNIDTYVLTNGKEKIKLDEDILIRVHSPIYYKNSLYEVFPNLNIKKIEDRNVYLMKLYFNLVKGLARNNTDVIKIKKNFYHVIYYNGLNNKDVYVNEDKITSMKKFKYSVLNETLSYIVAQFLFERLEEKPYVLELDSKKIRNITIIKYYISRCYYSVWSMIRDYLTCDTKKIEKRFSQLGFNSLREIEKELKRN